MIYLPFSERTPDVQYRRALRTILQSGEKTKSQQGEDAFTYFGIVMHFPFDNGFPMITERNMNPPESTTLPVTIWRQAIGEICAFINGATTLEKLKEFGCNWWEPWGTHEKCAKRGLPDGDIGPRSYGGAFQRFPDLEKLQNLLLQEIEHVRGSIGTSTMRFVFESDRGFNQFYHMVEQMREMPHLRTHFVSPWYPPDIFRGTGRQQRIVVAPCHGWIHANIVNGKLTLVMWQRSGDMVVGVPNNMIQYAALTLMLAQVVGVVPHEYVHMISNAHIYCNQIPAVEKMLSRDPLPFPMVTIADSSIRDIFAFRYNHFILDEYNPHPGIKGIPIAI